QSAATGVVAGLMSILQAFGFMFGHGAGSNISRHLGSRNIREAREYASTSFYYSILAGALVMVVGLVFMDPLMRLLGSTDTILPYARQYALWILLAGPAMTSSCVMNNILRYEGKAVFAMFGLTAGG
ncbi:MAG TPA: MATE family efflux transporter, partial [Erysipelotrichaceae bacterium]|nr:MATE family efflux transporter [Erysipelotrichaceae bacterium]